MALLPPVHLYRRLLRAHRKHLPAEMRILGDEYIKAEFRAHRKADNPAHLVNQHIIKLGILSTLTNALVDWILDRVAAVCSKD